MANWMKSSYSTSANPNCVEVAWQKSSYSEGHGGNCVECRTTDTRVQIRDTRHRRLGHLSVPAPEWRAFIHALRREEL